MVLARARCYMNQTGGPVASLAAFYRVRPDHIVAVHDEIDLPFDSLRVKLGGGDNGHNGLRSMRSALGTGDFHRVRVGVGRPPGRQDVADFVLSDFSAAERKELPLSGERRGRRRGDSGGRGPARHPAALQLVETHVTYHGFPG